MIVAVSVLFFTVLGAGWLVRFLPRDNQRWLKLLLAFSGAYLFALTILHILPDVLLSTEDPHRVGFYILAGFFLQLVLEVFSHGVEHGHIHAHPEGNGHHHHGSSVPVLLLTSLIIHSFLEGSVMVQSRMAAQQAHEHLHSHAHVGDNFYHILAGIALHHIPAAIALMSVLVTQLHSFKKAFGYLLLFAVASPVGLLFSNYVALEKLLSGEAYTVLSGLVVGNFLHISTTILFETSPEHRFNQGKLLATLAGALIAIGAGML
ncbi:ZIP family metal transporter [Rufibacter tibetensis]|uniref:Zinc/iron permease n=1 Tax=Rufibacter tibetensis TaxID=512763 RepID=A0A0P0CXE8_9BACT|nr:ZIP family metal transporter [Rufibacter tibetensis]ALI99074.1 zinc/iron permease [Rufibacter tibetensis]